MDTINFTDLSLEEANLIMEGLGELPAKKSINLITKLQQQATPQIKQNKVVEPVSDNKEDKPDIPKKA